jgi:hypothetical protein
MPTREGRQGAGVKRSVAACGIWIHPPSPDTDAGAPLGPGLTTHACAGATPMPLPWPALEVGHGDGRGQATKTPA